MGIEVLYGPWAGNFEKWIKVNGAEIDEVLLSRPMIAPMFLPALRKYCKAPIVFYGHDIHYLRMEKEAETVKDQTKFNAAQEMKEFERRVWLSVDHVLYPSEEEAKTVAEVEPSVHSSAILPYAFDHVTARPAPPPSSSEIIFVAGFRHSPNADGAVWFCKEVFPRIKARHPAAKVILIGTEPPGVVQALAGNDIEVTGYVSDAELERRYAAARVAVAPLRFGAGVKMKVAEAMVYGIPAVSTTVGAQGFEGLEKIIDVRDDPEAFAEAVIRLLENDTLWVAQSAAQAQYVTRRFSASNMRDGLEAAFATVTNVPYEAVA